MSPFFLNSAAVLFLFIILTQQGASQELILTPSSPTSCSGEVITLVCQHPLLATNATRYLTAVPDWRENGSTIRIAIGTRYQATTAADFMSTTLTFTISADYFSGRTFYYDCFLILATMEYETSRNATVTVLELSSPVLTSTTSLEYSITVEWLAVNCARSYNISWQCTEPRSTGSNITTDTTITIPVDSNSKCTLSLVAVYGDGSTGPVTTAVVHPGYPRPTADPSTSTSQDLILTCQFGGVEYTDIQWTSSRGPVDSSDDQLTLNYTTLQRGTEFWCSGVPMGRAYRVIGHSYIYNGATCPPVVCPPTAPPSTVAGGSIAGVLVAVIIFIAGGVSGVLAQVLYRKVTAKKSAAPPSSPPAPSYGHTQGDVGAGPEMTDNPSYQLVERSQDSKQLYQNI